MNRSRLAPEISQLSCPAAGHISLARSLLFLRFADPDTSSHRNKQPRIWIFYENLKLLDNDRDALTASDARRGQAITTITTLQFAQQS